MIKSIVGRRSGKNRFSQAGIRSKMHPRMIESLESRQLLSVSPVLSAAAVAKTPPLVSLSAATPGKILAGSKPGYEVVTVRNLTALVETESVTVTIAPSLDGVTAAGAYGTPSLTETVTIKKHGSVKIKVPFVPPITLAAGKYHTLATVNVAGDIVTGTAPGTYTLTLPPLPTTTPTLVGRFVGLIVATSSQSTGFFGGGTTTTVHEASIIWQADTQTAGSLNPDGTFATDGSLTGIFAVGDQETGGTMTGYELTNGVIHYTLTSDLINYTVDAKITNNGTKISGKFKGTLVNNIFKSLGGSFHMTLED